MIKIQKGQVVAANTDYIVLAPTGDYDEIDLLECAHKDRPGVSVCMYQVQCIKFGNMVYQQDEVLTEKQVALLLAGSTEQIIGNRKYIDGFIKPGARAGKIFGKSGLVKGADLPEANEDVEVDDANDGENTETPTEVPTETNEEGVPALEVVEEKPEEINDAMSTTSPRTNNRTQKR